MCVQMYYNVKLKNEKLDNSSSPIKTTELEPDSSGFQYEQSSHSPLLKSKGVTAVMAMLAEPTGDQPGQPSKTSKYKSKYKKPKTSSKKVQKPKLIRVLLDSGSDGDLPNTFPTRLGRCQNHGARRMGSSTQRKEVS